MSRHQPIVVLIEDQPEIRRFVRAALEEEACRVFEAGTAGDGLADLAARRPDLVILDLGLPDRNGIGVVRDLRSWSDVPVIILSARSNEDDKIAALDAGADDYLTKPFGVGELLARVRTQLRRRSRTGEDASPIFRFGEVEADLSQRTVTKRGEPVRLTPIEYRLLTVLITHASKVLTHRQLLKEVWGPGRIEHSHYLRIYVGHLRQKLEDDPAQPQHILTETGIGYRFVP